LDTFISQGGGIEAQKTFWTINKRMADILSSMTAKILETKDINEWHSFLKYRIEQFIEIWNVDDIKKSLEAGRSDIPIIITNIRAAIAMIKKEIEAYESKFGSTFDPSLSSKLDSHVSLIESEFRVFLGEDKISEEPMDIKTMDSDKLIDLYQEIAAMPLDDAKRLDKIKEFENLQRILKSSFGFSIKTGTSSRDFRKEALRNMEELEMPTVRKFEGPVFKPDTETGIASEFDAPKFDPSKRDLFKHREPTVISDYDLLNSIEQMPHNKKDLRIIRLKYLQQAHNSLIDNMFKELGKKLEHKEISDRFWDVLPADIRAKYKDKVGSIRSKIRDIYQQFPQHFEQYKKQNKPYFRKQEKQVVRDVS
jgi:hypothetical protein